jgi:alkanesulfonate monooxygenase SsuD/methylene tetrahydromethanopterin reductase-like flavin-dependent oxidoreductase (luciferase family)
LRTVARRADAWNTSGTVEEVRTKLDILAEHCADVGRDIATIEKTVSFPTVLRDDPAQARTTFEALLAANGENDARTSELLLCTPTEAADRIRPYQEMGFSTVIVRMPAPYDRETIDRIGEVRQLLGT